MKYHKLWVWAVVFCSAIALYTGYKRRQEDKETIDCPECKRVGLFLGGTPFGTADVRVLASTDAKKFYIDCLVVGLRAKDCVMTTATNIQENAEDILAEAKEINVKCKQEGVFEDESGAEDQAVSEKMAEEPVNVVTE